MKICSRLWGLLLLCVGLNSATQPPSAPTRYYVQLIWGTNAKKPAEAHFRPVGPKLRSELSRVFQWRAYWEVNRQPVEVGPGQPASVRMSPECEVQIEVSAPDFREVRIYGKGILVAKLRQRMQCHGMTIHGGSLATGGSWFVVVREDMPKEETHGTPIDTKP